MRHMRYSDRLIQWILFGLILIISAGYAAHAQVLAEPTNGVLAERIAAVVARVEAIESLQRYILLGIIGNLISHIFQIQRQGGRRT